MHSDLDKQLVSNYPKIFRDRLAPMTDTAMCWGFEHGDGWFHPLNQACFLIQRHIDSSRSDRARILRYNRALKRAFSGDVSALERYYAGKGPVNDWCRKTAAQDAATGNFRAVPNDCPQVVATQVKEKFGTLRFYYYGGDEYVQGVENMLAAMSEVTCEVCSRPGTLFAQGWVVCRCPECRAQEQGQGARVA